MTVLAAVLESGRPVAGHAPWPRVVIDGEGWIAATAGLAAGRWSLLGLWGERDAVHMALCDPGAAEVGVVSLDCPDRRYPSVARLHPPASRLERAARDLFGLEPEGGPDSRPWLDHGRWGVRRPLGERREQPATSPPYPFLPAEGDNLHRIPVGPVHAGIIEPGHFRFTAAGETVVRLEERLGYVHRGVEGLMAGADLERAATIAGRVSGDSTVAYAFAFARAVEAALGIAPPPRAEWLRAAMAELERLANHLGDIGAVCNDAAFALMHANCGTLREQVLRAAEAAFGSRSMRDRIRPGGVATDLDADGVGTLLTLVGEVRRSFPPLVALYDRTASLQDRLFGTGILDPGLADRYAAGGFVGRASGRSIDARRHPGYPPYDRLDFEVPVLRAGDVRARVWVRIREVEQCLSLIETLVAGLPAGPVRVAVPSPDGPCEGMSLVESFRGDLLAWLRIDAAGHVARCHLRDPSWFQWPLLEAVIEGNIVADFPLCNKSFNCSYAGHDL